MNVSRAPGRAGALLTVLTVATVLALTGCDVANKTPHRSDVGAGGTFAQGGQRQAASQTKPVPAAKGSGEQDNAPIQEGTMQIDIRVGNERFTATLADTAAARDLVAQLPLTVHMRDHGGVEKTGPFQGPLSLAGQPAGADPDVGDLGYYAPGNDLVLYYGDQSYYDGIVLLGALAPGAAPRLAAMPGDITAVVTARGS